MISYIKKFFSGKSDKYAYWLTAVILIRAWLNASVPLMDKTEARYAEIARIMSETGNWIVPQIDYGVPFWAKPPLSTWASAACISLFGTHEFAVRLPYLIVSIIMAIAIARYASKNNVSFFLPALILFTVPEFFLHAGVVSTDVMLAFSVAIVMLSFWEFINNDSSKKAGLLFFAGMGIGLLAKGPIVGILTLPPLFFWCVLFKISLKKLFKFPWVTGPLIMLLISLPWYFMMEIISPGFNDYFIVGEHFKRFFDSSWTGDKYGFPKQQPFGIIWVFLLITTVPWIGIVIAKLFQNFKTILADKWRLFLWLWLIWTPLFFSISKSLIHPYILPVMIPIVLLVVHEWEKIKYRKRILAVGLFIPLAMFVILLSGLAKPFFKDNTDKYFLAHPVLSSNTVFSLDDRSYSSQFYSKGKVKQINSRQLDSLLKLKLQFAVLIEKNKWTGLRALELNEIIRITENKRKGVFVPAYSTLK